MEGREMSKMNRKENLIIISLVFLALFLPWDWNGPILATQPKGKANAVKTYKANAVKMYDDGEDYASGEVLVLLSADVNRNGIIEARENLKGVESVIRGTILRQLFLSRGRQILKVKLAEGKSVKTAVAEKWGKQDQRIIAVEPNYRVHILDTAPNDPRYPELWGLNNIGQTGGLTDADIDAPEAWDYETGSSDVIIAVIDSGIDYLQPDLVENMWVNTGEIPDNGIDDDGNGYIDDIHGYDFHQVDSDPSDAYGHGTHCAGTIAGRGNNGLGVTGVSWQAKLMACRFLSASGSGWTSDAIEAINYAVANGAKVLSNSWGGGGYSESLKAAIENARDNGVLFIAAAGNNGQDNDAIPHYPSSYNVSNVLAVAATDHNDALATFSNYGDESVHLAAPGVSILSTVPYHETIFYEDFQGAILPGFEGTQMMPEGPANRWGTINNVVNPGNIVARGDWENAQPYLGDSDGAIVTPPMDTRGLRGLSVEFLYRYEIGSTDILTMDVWDGTSWRTLFSRNSDCCFGQDYFYFIRVDIPEDAQNDQMKIRFRWVTDSDDNNYYGGEVDDIRIQYIMDGTEDYGLKNGTSMATPHVSGAAALIWAQNPSFTLSEVKRLILNTVDPLDSLSGKLIHDGRLNIYSSLSCVPGNVHMNILSPGHDFLAYMGHDKSVKIALSDCQSAVTDAAVQVTPTNGDAAFDLLDDGMAPDATANDGIYTGNWNPVHLGLTELNITATGSFGSMEESVSGEVIVYGPFIFDQGPLTGANGGCWANITDWQNFAEQVSFPDDTTITEIRIFTCIGPRSGDVHVKILDDAGGQPGTYLYEEDKTPDSWIADPDGGGYVLTVLLQQPFVAMANIVYWIGVSGNGNELGQYSVLTPGDGTMVQFDDRVFNHHAHIGDMMFQLTGGNIIVPCGEDDTGALDIAGAAGAIGDTVTIPVRIQNAPDAVSSIGFEVFLPSVLTFTEHTRGPLVADFDFFDCNIPDDKPDVVRCGGFKAEGGIAAGASGDVVLLTFDVSPACEGIWTVGLQELKDDIKTWSATSGCFDCSVTCDVNGDGEVTPRDALCAFQKYLGYPDTACGPAEEIFCDVTGDGDCTPADALEIFKEYLGLASLCSE
jgi:subtilisin family serine protease